MPEGKVGNPPFGLFHTLCLSSQKQRKQFSINDNDEGDTLKTSFDSDFAFMIKHLEKERRGNY